MAAQLLASHGMDLARTRMMVRNILSGNQIEPESDPFSRQRSFPRQTGSPGA